jgi:hypothetical protein
MKSLKSTPRVYEGINSEQNVFQHLEEMLNQVITQNFRSARLTYSDLKFCL